MTEKADDLTIAYSENGQDLVKELDKVILTKGAWTTILFRYQEWSNTKKEFGSAKYSIRRYQKRNNAYQLKSKFNISSVDQARQLISILTAWLDKE